MTVSSVIWDKFGVMTRTEPNGEVFVAPIIKGYHINEMIGFWHPNRADTHLHGMTSDIEGDPQTGLITFTHEGNQYRVRDLREEDGYWLSAFKIALTEKILEGILVGTLPLKIGLSFGRTEEQLHPAESLYIAYDPTDNYVIALVYTLGAREWVRTDGDWKLRGPVDETVRKLRKIFINPDHAKDLVSRMDADPIQVTDALFFCVPTVSDEPGSFLKSPLDFSGSSMPESYKTTYHLSLVTPEKDYHQISNDGLEQTEVRHQYIDAQKWIKDQSGMDYRGFMLMVLEDQSGMSVAYESF
jgi:frataxin-like iron-binding protein CyaY